MKRTFRILATFLSIALIICALPQSVLAQIGDLLSDQDTKATETVSPDIYVLGEVIDNRTETSKTFRMSDGSFIAADYGQVIHYAGEDGAWTDYDNTLTFSEASARDVDDMAGYGNTGSNLRIKLANNSNSNNLLKLTFENYKVSMHLVGANKSKALEVYPAMEDPEGNDIDSVATLHKFSAGAIYEDILPDVDLEYIISGGSVKENIIIKDTADSYTYTFELKLHGLTPEVDSEGNILLKDETTGETQLVIPAGYMFDANGAYSDAVSYSIAHKNGQKYTLTVTADADWINANDRAFPVTVDPTVEAENSSGSYIEDSYVCEGTPVTNHCLSADLYAGYSASGLRTRTYIKLNGLPEIPRSAVVVNATLTLIQHTYIDRTDSYTGTADEMYLAARKVTTDWAEDTLTWNNQPSYDSAVLDYITVDRNSSGTSYRLDITSAVQEWYGDNTKNHGVSIYPIYEYNGSGTYARAGFYSANYNEILSGVQPVFRIHYRDTKGLESIWTYASYGAGSAGTGYVNGFNGNLVFVHNDIATEGSIIPISVSHVYNSSLAGADFTSGSGVNAPTTANFSDILVGKGWKLSLLETIVDVTINDETWYVYNDADGTELYFMQDSENSARYISEDGYGLYITVESDGGVILTDDYGNVKRFDSIGRLREIEDVYGNLKHLSYSADRLIAVLYRPANETNYIPQLNFSYNSAGAIYRITNSYNTADYVEFYYSETYNGSVSTDTAGYLRKITYSLGGQSTYTYNSDGFLISAQDGDTGYMVEYSYINQLGNTRVLTVSENHGGSTPGQTIGFEYAHKRFTIRDGGLDDTYGNYDDIQTTVLFDNFGRAVCSYSSNIPSATLYGTSYAQYTPYELGAKDNNKVTVDAVKGITNENLVTNGNARTLSGWADNSSGAGYSATFHSVSFMGNTSFKLASTSGGSGSARLTTSVAIPTSGTYTLSAYVKAEGLTVSSDGAYVSLAGTASERVKTDTNTDVQDGWRRISVTKSLSAGSSIIELILEGAVGTVYFDCIQLEKSDVPSDFNLVQNGSIRSQTSWTGVFSTLASEASRGHVGVITGVPSERRRVSQITFVNAPSNTTFMLSGWARANSVALSQEGKTSDTQVDRRFGLRAALVYSDGSIEEQFVSFNPDITDWQYAALAIVPEKMEENLTIDSITVAAVYDYNANTMYFDDLCLTVEPAQTYDYDENGNLTIATDAEGNSSLTEYATNGVDPQAYTTVTGDKYAYTYHTVGNVNTHDVKTVARIENDNVTQALTYDYNEYGNVISSELTAANTTEKFSSSAIYQEYGNYLWKATDSLGGVTEYSYDSVTKLLKFIEDVNGNQTAYKYDIRQRVTNVYLDADEDGVIDTTEASVLYLYAQNRLAGIKTATTEYSLNYDVFGNLKTVVAGSNTLATYEYTAGNGKLTKLTYGNGNYEQYVYDALDRLVKVVYNGNASTGYELFYDANGRVYKTVDYQAGLTHLYEYDSLNRLIFAWQKNTSTGSTVLEVQNAYDELGRAKGSTYVIGDTTQTYGITYEDITGLVQNYTAPHNSFTYSYDEFDRLERKLGTAHAIDYTYVAGSQRIASYTIARMNNASTTYSYTYDALGNITQIKKNGTTIRAYVYDALGRLTREVNNELQTAVNYTYDNAGNILTKQETNPMGGVISSVSYGYSTSTWGDLLTTYNGTSINYDAIGNPLNWRNADDMEWHQRSLQSMILSDGTAVSFQYNADGIRTKKTVGTAVHNYVLDGSTILKETITTGSATTTLYYYYDESGISGLEYNGTKYSYVKNLQGDVIGIINANGVAVVEYKYDAWGNILSVTGSMASTLGTTNPFRYRGYYYDTESGWYYLNSRYYDPQVGRFLNEDSIIGANGGLVGYNMFAYCNDNPVMYSDPSGQVVGWVLLGIATGFVAVFVFADEDEAEEKEIAENIQGAVWSYNFERFLPNTSELYSKFEEMASYIDMALNALAVIKDRGPTQQVQYMIVLNMLLWNADKSTPIIDFGLYNYNKYCQHFKKDAQFLYLDSVLNHEKLSIESIDAIVANWETKVPSIHKTTLIVKAANVVGIALDALESFYSGIIDYYASKFEIDGVFGAILGAIVGT